MRSRAEWLPHIREWLVECAWCKRQFSPQPLDLPAERIAKLNGATTMVACPRCDRYIEYPLPVRVGRG